MTRTRRSARQAGTRFESLIVAYLATHVDDRIERRRLSGSKDRGDVSGLRHMGGRIVVECKDTARTNLAGWAAEAELARLNDDATVGIIVHKRHGRARASDQWVTMTLADLVSLITGNNDHREEQQ